jgi:NitT/TauT family transport system permease protein
MKPEKQRLTMRDLLQMLAPVGAILIVLALHLSLPNIYPAGYESKTYPCFLELCLGIYLIFFLVVCFVSKVRGQLLHLSWLLVAAFFLVEALDIATLKTGRLRLPFVPSPDKILSTIPANFKTLAISFLYSMRLLLSGIIIGIICGFISGVLIGWSKICNYWLTPVLKIIGPVPSAAWLPIVIVIFPTNYLASLALIVLGIWFPLTMMLSSAIRNTDKRLIETARVLGASEIYILFKVAVPAALPAMFNGLFMGFALSFTALVNAEMLGVKEGLGWYITWANSWGEFGKVYCTVGIFSVIFIMMINLLFKIRKRLLKWQKGMVRW